MIESVTFMALVAVRAAAKLAEHALDVHAQRTALRERRLLLEKAATLPTGIALHEHARESGWSVSAGEPQPARAAGRV